MTKLSSVVSNAVKQSSSIRLIVTLRPANADGLIYPPTYEGGKHIFRPAWIDGELRDAVLIDSVQSQANRIEDAILDAHRRGIITYPDIELQIDADTGKETYSVLELSHRVYDVSLRMGYLGDKLFAQSEVGKSIFGARTESAAALFEHAPITLVLGGWDSHGGGGPLAAKIPRLLSSEIIGLDAKPVEHGAVKFDPMDIRKEAGPLFESKDRERRFEVNKGKGKSTKEFKPSEIGLGNVPNFSSRGAVITEAVQTSVVSCAAVRRLRFETEKGSYSNDRDQAGQAATVLLGLYGLISQMDKGYFLRSRCDLIPVNKIQMEVIGRTLQEIETYELEADDMLTALNQSLGEAQKHNLKWRDDKLIVKGGERLIKMVERSRTAVKMEE
jgi:CRISPR-associated protein Csb1